MHTDLNTIYDGFRMRESINQTKDERKGSELLVKSMVKVDIKF